MNRKEKAIEYFRGSYNCAQSVILAYSDLVGISEINAKSIAAGFGGGIAQTKKTCGAITGAIMVIGLKYFNENKISESKEKTYKISQKFMEEFMKKHKSTDCEELSDEKLNIVGEDGKIIYKDCERYILDVCKILEKYL
ncbi:MAG: C_GCAxxG_C_C family protein [Ignavibacteriales bacterium]|nr:C_GCAxxG_C_C family protein [Ignavibacteriales bacterium]